MAIHRFPASFATSDSELLKLLENSPIDGKGKNEILRSFGAVQVWKEWFTRKYGALSEIWHRSNPDDPPDVNLVFENETIGLEETALMPSPLGHAEAIAEKINPAGGRSLPSISKRSSRDDLEALALGLTSSWANVSDEHKTAVTNLLLLVQKKLKNPASQIIFVRDAFSFGNADSEWLAAALWSAINEPGCDHFHDRTIILLNRSNDIQYFSALVRRGEPLQAQRDGRLAPVRPPLSFI